MKTIRITERLYLDSTKTKVVPQGDKRACYLWHVPGDEVPKSECDSVGYDPSPAPKPPKQPRKRTPKEHK